MTSVLRCGVLALAGLLGTACVTVPTGPSMMVLPGSGTSFEQFQADDYACRSWASQQTGTSTNQAATQAGIGAAAVGTAVGAAAGAAIGAAAGAPATGAAIGAGSGLLLGTAQGTANAAGSAYEVQQRYDFAYMQCMYAKGNQIPVAGGTYQKAGTYQNSAARSGRIPQPSRSHRSVPAPPAGTPPPPPPSAGSSAATPPPPPAGPPPPPPPDAE